MITCPSSAVSTPAISRSKVSFPQPEGPRILTSSPFSISMLTFSERYEYQSVSQYFSLIKMPFQIPSLMIPLLTCRHISPSTDLKCLLCFLLPRRNHFRSADPADFLRILHILRYFPP